MKDIDFINKYSETHYANKKELEVLFNEDELSKKWNEILNYRNCFKVETDIKDASSYSYSIIINNTLRNYSYNLDTSLLKNEILISSFDDNKKAHVLKNYKEKLIDSAIRYYQISNMSNKIKENILSNNAEQIPLKFEIINSLAKAFDYAVNENVSLKDAVFNSYLILSNDNEVTFRNSEKQDFSNVIYTEVANIKRNFENFISYIENNDVESSLLCLSIIFFFITNQPFSSFNEEIASLTCYLLLKRRGYMLSSFLLDFSSICFASSKTMQEKIIDSQNSLDLTYFIYYTFPYLIQDQKNITEYLLTIKNEIDSEALSTDIQKTILPEFKEEINKDEILNKTEKLLQLYPVLKRKEAHFYVTHCTIGLNYTISQFQKFENTVYETARTSMDALATLGFYNKKHIGNKYVYSPVVITSK